MEGQLEYGVKYHCVTISKTIRTTQLKKSWECNGSIEGVTLLYQHNSDFTI